jgi:hypothetical protein
MNFAILENRFFVLPNDVAEYYFVFSWFQVKFLERKLGILEWLRRGLFGPSSEMLRYSIKICHSCSSHIPFKVYYLLQYSYI